MFDLQQSVWYPGARKVFLDMEQFERLTHMLNHRQNPIQQKFIEVDQKLAALDQAHGGMISSLQTDGAATMKEIGDQQDKLQWLKAIRNPIRRR